MSDDRQLLRRLSTDRSEAAFGEIVARHVSLVYSAAFRQTNGDAHLAQDIAQLVFADLVRKAPALSENVVLAGWLHHATIFAARQILRGERRRRMREQQAVTMNAIESETENNDWQQIRPLLDDALNRLNKTNHDALLLRFFENQSLAQVGAHLGGSEDAARKRVNRGLEKLRAILTRRGVTTTAAALSTVISANAIQVAPVGLAATLANSSFAVTGTGTTFTFLKIMTATKLKLAVSAIVVAGTTAAFVVQQQNQNQLRDENKSLRQQIAQLQTGSENFSNRLAEIGDAKKLSDDQFNELLKLRGEVGVLRRQASNLEKQHEEDQTLQSQAAVVQNQTEQFSPSDLFQLHQVHIMDAMKQIGLAMRIYSGDNNDQYPTNFDQIKNELGGVTNFNGVALDSIEFVNAGLVNETMPDKIMLRERTPRQPPGGGGWERVYGFADGSVQTEHSNDGNFDAFEQQHTILQPANNQ